MKMVVQRVKKASVSINGEEYSSINKGILVLLGIKVDDTEDDINYIINKILNLRIFNDEDGIMNKSLVEVKGELLIVSNFTIYGNTRKGRRPNYTLAAKPEQAELLYNKLITKVSEAYDKVKTGVFREMMEVSLTNDGPITLIVSSEK